jgi:hypothetical protein
MPPAAILGLHMLASLIWLLSSFILSRTKAAWSASLFRWQMLAATLAVLSGGWVWSIFLKGLFGPPEMILAGGAVCAVAAAGVQGALVGGAVRRLRSGALSEEAAARKIVLGQRIGAGLLAVTLITMFAAPHAG